MKKINYEKQVMYHTVMIHSALVLALLWGLLGILFRSVKPFDAGTVTLVEFGAFAFVGALWALRDSYHKAIILRHAAASRLRMEFTRIDQVLSRSMFTSQEQVALRLSFTADRLLDVLDEEQLLAVLELQDAMDRLLERAQKHPTKDNLVVELTDVRNKLCAAKRTFE